MMKKRMNVLLIAVLFCLAQVSFAAIQSYYPVPPKVDQATYLEGMVGPYFRNLQRNSSLNGVFDSVLTDDTKVSWSHGQSGYMAGLTAGWRFTPYLAVELSWAWMAAQSITATETGNYKGNEYSLKSWWLCPAVRAMHRVMPGTFLFAKLGAMYVHSELDSTLYNGTTDVAITPRFSFWAPMGAVGVIYYLSTNWYGSLQYMVYGSGGQNQSDSSFAGTTTQYTSIKVPYTQLATLSIGYQIEL